MHQSRLLAEVRAQAALGHPFPDNRSAAKFTLEWLKFLKSEHRLEMARLRFQEECRKDLRKLKAQGRVRRVRGSVATSGVTRNVTASAVSTRMRLAAAQGRRPDRGASRGVPAARRGRRPPRPGEAPGSAVGTWTPAAAGADANPGTPRR